MKRKFDAASSFEKLSKEKLLVDIGGKKSRIDRPRLIVRSYLAKAMAGDVRAARMLLWLYHNSITYGDFTPEIILQAKSGKPGQQR